MVYFLATKMLREQGAGPTLLISPLLSLIRNQLEAAQRIGLTAATINSTTNKRDREKIGDKFVSNKVDVLLISPERLGNERFHQNILANNNIGLFVIDEAHCISDWGHDFRPDYRRILRVLQAMPSNVPVLATTATANDRVVKDVKDQLGKNIIVQRGLLVRESLKLQNINMPSREDRMAWLAKIVPTLSGSGIIYTLTKPDAESLAGWLRINSIDAKAYHAGISAGQDGGSVKEELEQQLLKNEIKVLVATVALGMGFDKPDLKFVIHFQRPASVVHYYQQVGRAGRNGKEAYGILLCGEEDDRIADYFIHNAFPPQQHISKILRVLDESDNGLSVSAMQRVLSLPKEQIEKTIKFLDIESPSPIVEIDSKWQVTAAAASYRVNQKYVDAIINIRKAEQQQMRDYMGYDGCLMAFLQDALDDPSPKACGQCRNCRPDLRLDETYDNELANRAGMFLHRNYQRLKPRKEWPVENKFIRSPLSDGILTEDTKAIFLLCGVFGIARSEKPLSLKEYNKLVNWLMRVGMRPKDLLQEEVTDEASMGSGIDKQRLEMLLDRGTELAFAIEEWQRNGIWIISRSDDDYPKRYKEHLKKESPPLLFGVGNRSLLSGGGLSIVGSHDGQIGKNFTREVAKLCAYNGMPVVSRGVWCVDQIAMDTALEAGGVTIGILAENLLKKSAERNYPQAIADGRLLLLSPYHPNASFHVGTDMARNKLIYAMSDYSLIVSADYKKGGTWAGVTEELKRENSRPVFVRIANNVPEGNTELLKLGAAPCPALTNNFLQQLHHDLANRAGVSTRRRNYQLLEPRNEWPNGYRFIQSPLSEGKIPPDQLAKQGFALSLWKDKGWWKLVYDGKYKTEQFADVLVAACVEMLQEWPPYPAPQWVTCIPSLKRPKLVADFAEKLADKLGLPFVACIQKIRANAYTDQKFIKKRHEQVKNLDGVFTITDKCRDEACLLVDDITASGWTFTVASALLRRAGCSAVYPMALALTSPRRD